MASAADSWNQVRQQTVRAATNFRNTVVNGYDHYDPTIKDHVQQGCHRLLTTATQTATTNTVEYITSDSTIYHRILKTATQTTTKSDSLTVVSTHTASDVLRSLLSPPLPMQRSSQPPPTTTIDMIDKGNATKNRTISTYFLAMYDDNYNHQHSAVAAMVDPCHLSKYDLKFPPFGLLLADGFFQSAYVPVCYPRRRKDTTCATFFSAPLQFLLDMVSNDDDYQTAEQQLDRWIPKQELHDAFQMYLHDELLSSIVVVVQWWRKNIAATHKRIVSNIVRVWIIVSLGIIQPAFIEQAIAAGMRTIMIGVEEGMAFFGGGIIWYPLLFQVMIGVMAACGVAKWLVHAIQNHHARRDRHHQQCHGRVARVLSDMGDSLPNDDDDSRDDSPSSLTSVRDNNSDGVVSTSDDDDGSSCQDEPSSSDRPPENLVAERKHANVNRKSNSKPQRKSLLGNILSFVTRKRKVDDDEEVKPPFPAWSQFACADTSRPYVEDYGDDDIGEGLGL
jgi:hypothetical protein